jgi:hypothetical protein
MISRRQSCCRRPTMSGFRFVFRTLSLLKTTIMLFIRSAPNCIFVRKNHQRKTRLKRLFKLYSLPIVSFNINIRPRSTKNMLTSSMTYSMLRSMMNLLLRIITNVVLGLFLFLRSIAMGRWLVLLRIIIRGKIVGLQGVDTIGVKTGSFQRQ